MKITLSNHQKTLTIKPPFWRKIVKEVAKFEGQDFAEFSLHFVDKEEIAQVHADFFDDPTPTDCISFPIDGPGEPYRVLGEVFVCPEVAKEYAELHKGEPLRETILYVVHGLLHLFGYDDIKTKDKRLMREAEKKHMDHLDEKGLTLG